MDLKDIIIGKEYLYIIGKKPEEGEKVVAVQECGIAGFLTVERESGHGKKLYDIPSDYKHKLYDAYWNVDIQFLHEITIDMDEIEEECRKRFPVGCKVKTLTNEVSVVKNHELSYSSDKLEHNQIWFKGHDYNMLVYDNGKWADVLEDVKPIYEVGKWYKFTAYSVPNQYGKVSNINDNDIICDIWLHPDKSVSKQGGTWCKTAWIDVKLITDLTEIQQYLPDNHPDKIQSKQFKVGDKVRVLSESSGWGNVKKGDIGTVKKVKSVELLVDFESQCDWYGLLKCFELVEDVKEEAVVNDILVTVLMSQGDACDTCKFTNNCNDGPHYPSGCHAYGGQHYPPDKKEDKWTAKVDDWVYILTDNPHGSSLKFGDIVKCVKYGNNDEAFKKESSVWHTTSEYYRKAAQEEIDSVTKPKKKVRVNENTDYQFKPGGYYVGTWDSVNRCIFKTKTESLTDGTWTIDSVNKYAYTVEGECTGTDITFRKAWPNEIKWLDLCIQNNKTMPDSSAEDGWLDDFLGPTKPEWTHDNWYVKVNNQEEANAVIRAAAKMYGYQVFDCLTHTYSWCFVTYGSEDAFRYQLSNIIDNKKERPISDFIKVESKAKSTRYIETMKFFEQLKEPHRSQAIKNYDEEFVSVIPDTLAEAIDNGFDWDVTSEGHDYWDEIHDSLKAFRESTKETDIAIVKTIELISKPKIKHEKVLVKEVKPIELGKSKVKVKPQIVTVKTI